EASPAVWETYAGEGTASGAAFSELPPGRRVSDLAPYGAAFRARAASEFPAARAKRVEAAGAQANGPVTALARGLSERAEAGRASATESNPVTPLPSYRTEAPNSKLQSSRPSSQR